MPFSDRTRINIIGEDDLGTHEDLVLDLHACGDVCETFHLASVAYFHASLDLDETRDPAILPNLAAIEIDEVSNDGPFAYLTIND
jgi:hypothetical protein